MLQKSSILTFLIISFLAAAHEAQAQRVIGFDWEPSAPVLGELTTYNPQFGGGGGYQPIFSIWARRFHSGGCLGPWQVMEIGEGVFSCSYFEGIPAQFDIKLVVMYAPDDNGVTPPDDEIQRSISIPCADGVQIVAGLNVPWELGDVPIEVRFRVKCQGRDCGDIQGAAQEFITNKKFLSPGYLEIPDDPAGYVPANPPHPLFYLSGADIVDLKATDLVPQIWNAIPIGTVFMTFTQNMRLIFDTPCGGHQIACYLPPLKFGRKKVSATEWMLVQDP